MGACDNVDDAARCIVLGRIVISLKGRALPHRATTSNSANTASPGTAWGIALGFLSVWIAAGSVGVLAASLREVLAVLVLLVAVACLWPRSLPAGRIALGLVVLACVTFRMLIPTQVYVWPLVTVSVVSLLAIGKRDADRHRLAWSGVSILAFMLYRMAQQSVPWVWQLSDALGGGLGGLVHGLTGRPLDVGASFGGVDFLVLTSVFYLGWLVALPAPRAVPAVFAGIAIVAGHLTYLVVLAFSPELTRMAPPVELPPFRNPYIPPEVDWSRILHQLLPWNLPVLAGVWHAVMVWSMVRWGRWQARVGTPAARERGETADGRQSAAVLAGLVVLAALPAVFAVLRTAPSQLTGRTILAGPDEMLDWRVPLHDRYGRDSAGTFGMLPLLVESLGGNLRRSDAFSAAELESADAVLLLAPDEPLAADQQQRIGEYVQAGGAVLVVAEAFDPGGGWNVAIDDLLAPTSIRVARDAALSVTGDWWESADVGSHAATAAVNPRQVRFLSDEGASIRWDGARGRCWSAAGDGAGRNGPRGGTAPSRFAWGRNWAIWCWPRNSALAGERWSCWGTSSV
jgi:hypothetical protein